MPRTKKPNPQAALDILRDLRAWYQATDIGPHGSALLADGDITLRERIEDALGVQHDDPPSDR